MKGLLIKDLKLISNQKKIFIFAILFGALFTWSGNDVTFSATYIILLMSMMTLTTISYDDANGSMLFMLSLPTTRKSYVIEKYVLAFINLVFSFSVAVIVCLIFGAAKGLDVNVGDIVSSAMGTTVAMSIMLAFSIPLELKYGAEKGRIAMIVAIAGVSIFCIGGYKLLTSVFDVDIKKILLDIVAKLPSTKGAFEAVVIGVALVTITVMLLISCAVSNKVMKKKEF